MLKSSTRSKISHLPRVRKINRFTSIHKASVTSEIILCWNEPARSELSTAKSIGPDRLETETTVPKDPRLAIRNVTAF